MRICCTPMFGPAAAFGRCCLTMMPVTISLLSPSHPLRIYRLGWGRPCTHFVQYEDQMPRHDRQAYLCMLQTKAPVRIVHNYRHHRIRHQVQSMQRTLVCQLHHHRARGADTRQRLMRMMIIHTANQSPRLDLPMGIQRYNKIKLTEYIRVYTYVRICWVLPSQDFWRRPKTSETSEVSLKLQKTIQ